MREKSKIKVSYNSLNFFVYSYCVKHDSSTGIIAMHAIDRISALKEIISTVICGNSIAIKSLPLIKCFKVKYRLIIELFLHREVEKQIQEVHKEECADPNNPF